MRLLCPLAFFVFAILPAAAQQQRLDTRAVDRVVLDAMRAWNLPGVAIAIVRNDRVAYVNGYGTTRLGGGDRITPDTVFQIASTSKAFTTTGLAMLVDEKKLSWDDPVRRHLPSFRLADVCADANVTVRDLVSHRTGLQRHDELWDNSPWSREEVLRRIADVELSRPFRSGYQYQNIMFIAAGEIVARASGMPWDEFLRSRIFEPLNMRNTFTSDEEWERANRAIGHRYYARTGETREQPPISTANLGGAGAIKSTARDMANWLRFQLAGGAFDLVQLVSEDALGETKMPQTVIALQPTTRENNPETHLMAYGLGWVIQDYRGDLLVSHAGALNGFRAHVDLLPKRNAGFVIMTNTGRSIALVAMRNALADLLTGKNGRDWNAYYQMIDRRNEGRAEARRQARAASRHAGTAPSHRLDAYAGTYQHPAYGELRVTAGEGGLRLNWSRLDVPLEHFHYDLFLAESEEDFLDDQVSFTTGSDGGIGALTFLGQRFERVRE